MAYDPNTYDLQADVEAKFPRVWESILKRDKPIPQERPVATLVGGQPGAGKSYGIGKVQARMDSTAVVINGDDYRSLRAGYDEICEKYGKEASKYTGDFSGAMVQRVRDEAVRQNYNIILEGTFRTAEIPLREMDNFRKHGYAVDVAICTCPKDVSWRSTIERGDLETSENLKNNDNRPGRYTPKEHHDLVVENLAANADTIYQSGKFRTYEVYNREGLLYSNRTNLNEKPGKYIQQELNRLQVKISPAKLAEGLAKKAVQQKQQLTAYKPPEQAKIQSVKDTVQQQSQKAGETQNNKPKV